MKNSTILAIAKSLINSGWSKGSLALDIGGSMSDIHSPYTVDVCTIAAVYRATGSQVDEDGQPALRYLKWVAKGGLVEFNDDPDTTLNDVLLMFDKAYNLAVSEGD